MFIGYIINPNNCFSNDSYLKHSFTLPLDSCSFVRQFFIPGGAFEEEIGLLANFDNPKAMIFAYETSNTKKAPEFRKFPLAILVV